MPIIKFSGNVSPLGNVCEKCCDFKIVFTNCPIAIHISLSSSGELMSLYPPDIRKIAWSDNIFFVVAMFIQFLFYRLLQMLLLLARSYLHLHKQEHWL